jgi:hypothetical protein
MKLIVMLDENNCQIIKYFDFPLRIELNRHK